MNVAQCSEATLSCVTIYACIYSQLTVLMHSAQGSVFTPVIFYGAAITSKQGALCKFDTDISPCNSQGIKC